MWPGVSRSMASSRAPGLLLLLLGVGTTLCVVVPDAVSVPGSRPAAGESDHWACECTKLQDEQHGFTLDDNVQLVPGMGDPHCKGTGRGWAGKRY